jgi:hypothetical protein
MIPGAKDAIKGAIEGVLGGAASIIERFKADPTKVLEAQTELEKLRITAENEAQKVEAQLEDTFAKELETVNATMREESKSEHWMQWAWRPLIGMTFCAILFNNYILLPYFAKMGIKPIDVPGDVWSAILVILGVASAGRSIRRSKWGK